MTADYLDETELIEQAKTDPEAFGQLYERYVDRVYSFIYYRTSNKAEAEDLTAKVFFRALDNIGRFKQKGAPFSAWLFRIARNLVANWHRDNSRRPTVPLDNLVLNADQQNNPHHVAEQSNRRELLLAAIRRLPDDRQNLLLLKYVERLSNAEIGQVMGRGEGAIKSLYYRTLASLKSLLADHENLVKELPEDV